MAHGRSLIVSTVLASYHGDHREQLVVGRALAGVAQEDVLLPQMTVLETLSFHAALRLPAGMAGAARRARLDEVLRAMGLSAHQHTLVRAFVSSGERLAGRVRKGMQKR